MKIVQKICLAFTIIGAVNWGLIGFFDYNLVSALFESEMIQRVIYSIVGICGLVNLGLYFYELHED